MNKASLYPEAIYRATDAAVRLSKTFFMCSVLSFGNPVISRSSVNDIHRPIIGHFLAETSVIRSVIPERVK